MTLASAVASTDIDAAPSVVRQRVVDLVADTVAVTSLGSARPELRALMADLDTVTPEGEATVVGSGRGWPSGVAAFLNGCAAAADQLQDGHRLARGHPASHVVPAALAVAEERNLPGREALSAVLAGYEVGCRVGMAMGGTPDGVHDIGTWGAIGAAAGVARLLAPGDEAASQRALDLSAAAVLLTDADPIFGGRTGGHAFLGASIQLGVTLGVAAVAGLDAGSSSLERHLARVAARHWSPEHLDVGGTWSHHEVLRGYLKLHPTCAHLHGVNDAVADLLETAGRSLEPFTAAEIARVEVNVFAGASQFDRPADHELAARFSIPTSVAVALVHGSLDETTMTPEIVTSAAVHEVAQRVSVVHDPDLDSGYPSGRPARVTVHLTDGTAYRASSTRPRGDADAAFPRDVLRAKAIRLLTGRVGARRSEEIFAAIDGLEEAGPRALGQTLRRAMTEESNDE